MRGDDVRAAIEAEVAQWPGVSVTFEGKGRGPHPKARLEFKPEEGDPLILRRAYGDQTEDPITILKVLRDMRGVLAQLGAKRREEPTAEADEAAVKRYRKPNDGREKRPHPVEGEPGEDKPTIAEQLAGHPAAKELGLEGEPGTQERPAGGTITRRNAEILATKQPALEAAFGRRIEVDPSVQRSGWGLYTDIEAVDYHLDPAPEPSISNSLMDPLLTKTPRDFAWGHPRRQELVPGWTADPEARKATIAMVRGDVVHQLALGKGRGYAVGEFKDWRTKAAQAFKEEAEEDGLTPIIQEKFEEAQVLAEIVREAIKRALDGADYQTEVVFMYQEMTDFGPIWVRGMMDVYCPERAIILDPKITAQLYDGKIERHALNMGWDRQAALYQRAIGLIFPELAGRVTFGDVLVNPDPPHVSRLWAPERMWIGSSARQCLMAFERYGECFSRKVWPGFPGNKIERGPMPAWEDKRRTEQELGA